MTAETGQKISVLIVEDEMMVAMHLAMVVRNLGHDVVGIAVDQSHALTFADKNPDLALVDNSLRDGQTGPLIAQQLIQNAHTHVIFVTANPARVRDASPQHPAILGVCPKPVNDNDIQQLLSYAADMRRSGGHVAGGHVAPPPSLHPL